MIIMTQEHEIKKQKKTVNVFDLEYIIYRKLAIIIKRFHDQQCLEIRSEIPLYLVKGIYKGLLKLAICGLIVPNLLL